MIDTSKETEDISLQSCEILQTFVWWGGVGGGGGLHESASHHTNVCKIPRLCAAVSSLVSNKSLSNWSTFYRFFMRSFQPCSVDRFSLTVRSQKLEKIMDRKPGQITTTFPRVSIRSHRPKPSQTPHTVYTT